MNDFEADIHELLETIKFNQTATIEQRYNQKLNLRLKEIQSTYDEKGPVAAAHFSALGLLDRFENFWNTLHHNLTEWNTQLRTAAGYYGYMMEGEKAAYDKLLFSKDVWPVFSRATPMPVIEFGDPSYSYHEVLTKLIWPVLMSARGIALLTSPKGNSEFALRPDVVYECADEIAAQIASLDPINFELLSYHLDKEFERAGGHIIEGFEVTSSESNGTALLRPQQQELVDLIASAGHRLSTAEVMQEFARQLKRRSLGKTKNILATLTQFGPLNNTTDEHGAGYGLREWSNNR